ncbi:hypothetical protein [Lentzea cavernae]|uniref:Uncharacterized protein n=1 Tax=Lentzea cavernae TaxID=2020703 RepID=A0ABQ3MHH2_9PSEU|nr:hypothetical protein [Lentzea cavernae]GHH44269.1 hypothetical protein GCM10017774_43540 [Lentzea cavernae]
MPRPLMNNRSDSVAQLGRTTGATGRAGTKVLGGRRSARYVRSLQALDGSGKVATADVSEIVDAVHREFADQFCSTPLGIVSRCYLGAPYEVHTLAMDGSIISHYRNGEPLPHGMDRARSLAESETYLAIEVYPDRLVCVRPDGSTVLLESDR